MSTETTSSASFRCGARARICAIRCTSSIRSESATTSTVSDVLIRAQNGAHRREGGLSLAIQNISVLKPRPFAEQVRDRPEGRRPGCTIALNARNRVCNSVNGHLRYALEFPASQYAAPQ